MPFQKGKSGNPGGRPKHRAFQDMLRLAVNEANANGSTRLRTIVDQLTRMAEEGDLQAIIAIADRLDGKPSQQLAVSTEEHTAVDLDALTDEELMAIARGDGVVRAA